MSWLRQLPIHSGAIESYSPLGSDDNSVQVRSNKSRLPLFCPSDGSWSVLTPSLPEGLCGLLRWLMAVFESLCQKLAVR